MARSLVALCVLTLGGVSASAAAGAPLNVSHSGQAAVRLSAHPVGSNAAWQRYVIDPGALVYPKSVQVLGASSAVSDPNGLTAAGGGITTIRATERACRA